ncbi:MAG: carboxypeptidase-like regulatory domain-containing protein [Candidatus Lokiarchaeia archaeon]
MDFKSSLFVKPLVFFLVSFLVFAGFPFGSSTNLQAQDEKGSIIGVVFQKEEISAEPGEDVQVTWPRIFYPYRPVAGAEVKAINNDTGEVFISYKTDKYGVYKIEGLPPGEYNIGVSTEEGDFISDIVVKVEPNKPAPVPLMLKSTKVAEKIAPKKKWYKRPIGILILLGSGVALGYGIYKAVASPSEPG